MSQLGSLYYVLLPDLCVNHLPESSWLEGCSRRRWIFKVKFSPKYYFLIFSYKFYLII